MPRRYWWLPGGITAGLLLAVGLGPLIALLSQAPLAATPLWQDPYLRQVVIFSLGQAALSTGLSLLLALPVSRALHRRRFAGRGLLLKLFGLSQVLPVIIALFGLVAVHGHGGWLARLLNFLGLSLPQYLYGLSGIVLAHLFFNVPLAARWWLQSLERLPANQWRLAEQLGLSGWSLFRHLEWPALRTQLPALAGLIFMLCFTSFATVMALGGGPGATTLEVAIYQALRYDFNLQAAGQLALWQLLLSGLILLLHHRWPSEPPQLKVSDHYRRQDGARLGARLHDGASLALVALLYLPPLLAILLSGLRPELWQALASPRLWHSTGQSLLIGTLAASLALGLTLLLLTSSRHLRLRLGRRHWAQGLESLGNLILVLPSAVLSTGLFILLMPFTDVFGLGLYLVVLINALASLPYTLRTLQPAMEAVAHRYDRLADSLGLAGLARLTRLEWPLLRPALGRAFALAMILSLGDLGAIALFGSGELQTLPWLLYQQLGSYRLNEAAATALLLLALCLALLGLLERGIGGKNADCR